MGWNPSKNDFTNSSCYETQYNLLRSFTVFSFNDFPLICWFLVFGSVFWKFFLCGSPEGRIFCVTSSHKNFIITNVATRFARWWFYIFFIFTPKLGVSWSNLTVAYVSNGLKPTTNKICNSQHGCNICFWSSEDDFDLSWNPWTSWALLL